jgi:hypothetical protein
MNSSTSEFIYEFIVVKVPDGKLELQVESESDQAARHCLRAGPV